MAGFTAPNGWPKLVMQDNFYITPIMVFTVKNKIGKLAPQALGTHICVSSHFIFGGSKMGTDLAFVAPSYAKMRIKAISTPPPPPHF